MISFWRIFLLEILTLSRSRTIGLLTTASVAWMAVFPRIVRGDGTEAGLRELTIHYSLGGVFVLLVIALIASATGTIATERAAKRLQLTMVRPVRYFVIVIGKMLAHLVVGAAVLATACAVLLVNVDRSRPCSHLLSPVMPSPQEEARTMYDEYMKDPETPENVRNAKKDVVLRLLAQKAADRFDTVATNETAVWRFVLPGYFAAPHAVRMRFTNQMEMRQDVVGAFGLGGMHGVVSNMTQAVLEIPLEGELKRGEGAVELSFRNDGKNSVMLRPRKDINLLIAADAFGWNLARAYLIMVAALALAIAGGVFLSAALGRPVAMFVAFVVLIVGEISPSVIEQYPDPLESNLADRIGLVITRTAVAITRPISSASPLAALATDECVELRTALRLAATNFVLLPLLLAFAAAVVLPRKQDE